MPKAIQKVKATPCEPPEFKELEPFAVKIDKVRMKAASVVLELGAILSEAQGTMSRHRSGLFNRWIEERCGFSVPHAYNCIRAAHTFNSVKFIEYIGDSAMYLLSAPSCPEEATSEAIERAEKGERITHKLAKEIVAKHGKQHAWLTNTGDACTVADLAILVDAGRTFGTIYADPPWQYGNQATRASTDNHYETMPLDDIAALPVEALAAEAAHLHLWTTNAFLFDAKDIIEAWGFTYKSCFVWVKPQMGIGNYWRVSHEFMLLGVRGSCTFPPSKAPMSWLEEPRSEHSRKPDAVRQLVEKVSPPPRLELFGRAAVDEWTVWGNEVSRELFTQGIAHV